MKPFLFKLATGRNILVCLILYIAMIAFVMAPAQKFMEAHGGAGPLDLLQFYNADQALKLIGRYDEEVLPFYQTIEYSADLLYPIIYTLLLGLLWLFLLKRAFRPSHWLHRCWFVPFVIMVFDLFENAGVILLLEQYPGFDRDTAAVTAVFSSLKWSLFYFSILLILLGVLRWVFLQKKVGKITIGGIQ